MNITRDHRAVRKPKPASTWPAQAPGCPASSCTTPRAVRSWRSALANPRGAITPEGRISLLPAVATDLRRRPPWAPSAGLNGAMASGKPVASGGCDRRSGRRPFRLAGTSGTMVYAGGVGAAAGGASPAGVSGVDGKLVFGAQHDGSGRLVFGDQGSAGAARRQCQYRRRFAGPGRACRCAPGRCWGLMPASRLDGTIELGVGCQRQPAASAR